MSDECVERKGFFSKLVLPRLGEIMVLFVVCSITAWGASIINTNDQQHSVEKITSIERRVDQEQKRNNIQDVTLGRVQERQTNQELTLNRIENTLSLLTGDLKEFMKAVPKEMKSMRKEMSDVNKTMAVLKDRDERDKQ